MSKHIISDSDEAWDEKELGADENFVEVVDATIEAAIDEAAGCQLISIRMQKAVIEDLKLIASFNGGIGYQTLMKQIIQRFVDSEKKRIFAELIAEKLKEQHKTIEGSKTRPSSSRQRKAA